MIICGLSSVDCHVKCCVSFAITSCTAPAIAVPDVDSGAAHTRLTSAVEPSLFFQCSHGCPLPSTKGCGSIDPPRSSWHTIGPPDESTNGPGCDDDVATVMPQCPELFMRAA